MAAEMVHAATFLKFTIIRVMIPETSNSVGVEFTVSSIGRKMADIPFDHFSGRWMGVKVGVSTAIGRTLKICIKSRNVPKWTEFILDVVEGVLYWNKIIWNF